MSKRKTLEDMTVLIIDDDEVLSAVLEAVFRRIGVYKVVSCGDSPVALAQLQQNPTAVDLVLLDLMMPGMDGIQFLGELARIEFPGYVILMSGSDIPILSSLQRLGTPRLRMLGVLAKPIRNAALRSLLKNIEQDEGAVRWRQLPRTSAKSISLGLLNCEFTPFFQPKVQLANSQVIGFEALARWRRPKGKPVPPLSFVPLAEKKGLIHQIDVAILEQTLACLQGWREQGIQMSAAVNCSVTTLNRLHFADVVLASLLKYQIAPSDLVVELTESVLVEEASNAMENILRLHLHGVRLAMDDFGTGYSNLRYLSQIPFSELKVDQCFVTGATGDPAKRAIIKHSIDLARKLGLSVVCEGIESAEDALLVRTLGADLGQGYYYNKPLPPDTFLAWIGTFNAKGDP